jgi:Rieske Fe-S protein
MSALIGGNAADAPRRVGVPCAAVDRRQFVALTAGALSAAAVAACATVAAVPMPVEGGQVRVPIRNHPGLDGPGGFLKVLPQGSQMPIYVLADGSGGWAALSPVCTHLGCVVEVEGAALVCPCHGSTYDRAGQVLEGPAERALTRYRVREEPEGTLLIELSGAGGAP